MRASLFGLFALTTLGLVGYAIYTLSSAQPVGPRTRTATDVRRQQGADPRLRGRVDPEGGTPLTRIARAIQDEASDPPPGFDPNIQAPEEDDDEAAEDAPEAALPISRAVAEATFDRLLTDLEEAEPEDLADRDRDGLYRNVNDAFTALSARLGEDDVELMEDSYQRMQAQMKRLKIKPPQLGDR